MQLEISKISRLLARPISQDKNNLIRNALAVGGLILIFLIPYLYAQDTAGKLPEILLLIYFIPTFFLFSDMNERKFILAVIFIAGMAESMNVGFGDYKYLDAIKVPNWVFIGWADTAWALITLNRMIKPNSNRNLTLGAITAIFAVYAIFASHSIEGFFINSFIMSAVFFSIKPKSYNIFLIAVIFGMVIEYSGVFLFGAWAYSIPPDLSRLGAMYSFIYFLASMLARYEL